MYAERRSDFRAVPSSADDAFMDVSSIFFAREGRAKGKSKGGTPNVNFFHTVHTYIDTSTGATH